jgi:hypothetical protein
MLKQVQVFVDNEPGKVFAIMQTLKNAQINVRAMSITESKDCGFVRLITDAPEKAQTALKADFNTVKIIDVIGFTVPDKFGALCDVLQILSDNAINVEYSYSLMGCKHGNANILICVKDVERAVAVLKQAEIKLFTQEDLNEQNKLA